MRRVLLVALLGKSDRVERELSDVRCKREDGREGRFRRIRLLSSLVKFHIFPIFGKTSRSPHTWSLAFTVLHD